MQIVKLLRLCALVLVLSCYAGVSHAAPITPGISYPAYVALPTTTPTEAIAALAQTQPFGAPRVTVSSPYPPYMYNGASYYPKPNSTNISILCNKSKIAEGDSPWYNIFQVDGNRYATCDDFQSRTKTLEDLLTQYYSGYFNKEYGEGDSYTVRRAKIATAEDLAEAKKELANVSAGVARAYTSLGGSDRVINAQPAVDAATAKLTAAQTALKACVERNSGQDTNCVAENTAVTTAKAELATAQGVLGQAETAANGGTPPNPCGALNFFTNFGVCFYRAITSIIAAIVLPIPAYILSFSAFLFDYSIYFSIIKFKALLSTVGGVDIPTEESPIYKTWQIVRNLFNVIIVFQLLKIAIYKILTPLSLGGKSGDLKKMLMSIIIFTLFTNFSFFFTKALIDFSNITSLQFYIATGANPAEGNEQNTGVAIIKSFGIESRSLLGAIVSTGDDTSNTGTATIEGTARGSLVSDPQGDLTKSVFGVFLLAILLLVVSLVLFQGAFIFITRSVILIFLITFSPLMFARGIFGPLEKWSQKWWNMLLEQLYTAPVYLGMLFITLKLAGSGEDGGLLTIVKKDGAFAPGYIALLFPAIIMGGLFFATAKLAKEFGGSAAEKSSAFGSKAFGAVVGGGLGYAGRKGFGRVANKISNSGTIRGWEKKGGVASFASRRLLSIADSGKNATFDLRNSGAVKGLDNLSGGKLGLKNLGQGEKLGFVKGREAAEKARIAKEIAESELLNIDTSRMTPEERKIAEKENIERQNEFLKRRAKQGGTLSSIGTNIVNPMNVVRGGTPSNTKTSYKVADQALKDVKKKRLKDRAQKQKETTLDEVMLKNVKYSLVDTDKKDANGELLKDSNGEIIKVLKKNSEEEREIALSSKEAMQESMDENIRTLEQMTEGIKETFEEFVLDERGKKIRDMSKDTEAGGWGYKTVTKTRKLGNIITDDASMAVAKTELATLKKYRSGITDRWMENRLEKSNDSSPGASSETKSTEKAS